MSSATGEFVTGDMYVKSVKGPLKVKIRFNEYRVIGTQQTVVMNALDDSSDRDADDDKAGMTFEWFCRRLDEASLEELVHSNATVPLPTDGESYCSITLLSCSRGVQWLTGRASDSRLREPGFESLAAVFKPWASFFTLHCSSSLS